MTDPLQRSNRNLPAEARHERVSAVHPKTPSSLDTRMPEFEPRLTAERFYRYHEGVDSSPRTIGAYRADLELLLEFLGEPFDIRTLTVQIIHEFFNSDAVKIGKTGNLQQQRGHDLGGCIARAMLALLGLTGHLQDFQLAVEQTLQRLQSITGRIFHDGHIPLGFQHGQPLNRTTVGHRWIVHIAKIFFQEMLVRRLLVGE